MSCTIKGKKREIIIETLRDWKFQGMYTQMMQINFNEVIVQGSETDTEHNYYFSNF